jgi:glycine amidinotransferase
MSNSSNNSPVHSHCEWDPLEEVIIGSVQGAMKIAFEPALNAYYPDKKMRKEKGESFSPEEIAEAEEQLNNLAKILSEKGIKVVRPEPIEFSASIQTPYFKVPNGNCCACPRDVLLIIGNKIIEAPMAQRGRFFEYLSYRKLAKEYFNRGADWIIAPKPSMNDELYVKDYSITEIPFDADTHPALTNFEPCFDAASFMRFGKDIFYHPDTVTNDFGVKWLERTLGPDYRFHRLKFEDKHAPQHIDTTLVPLRKGLVMTNPERPFKDNYADIFLNNNWRLIEAPPSVQNVEFHSPEVSNWISMNILSIDEETIVAEEKEESLIKLLEEHDFKVITCPFDKVYKFGGGFHCCSADIRRKGTLQSYFSNL